MTPAGTYTLVPATSSCFASFLDSTLGWDRGHIARPSFRVDGLGSRSGLAGAAPAPGLLWADASGLKPTDNCTNSSFVCLNRIVRWFPCVAWRLTVISEAFHLSGIKEFSSLFQIKTVVNSLWWSSVCPFIGVIYALALRFWLVIMSTFVLNAFCTSCCFLYELLIAAVTKLQRVSFWL